jgi:tryptophan synthase beta chain
VGPEHAALHDSGRVVYGKVSDGEALDAFALLSETEGILPALESAHAIAFARKLARRLPRSAWILVNLSGRGDKDLDEVLRVRGRGEGTPRRKGEPA